MKTFVPPAQRTWGWVPALVLVVGLSATAAGTWYLREASDSSERAALEQALDRSRDAIAKRIDTYIAMLRATSGLFRASPDLNRERFAAFAAQLDLPLNYPGTLGIGYSQRIRPGEMAAMEERAAAEGWVGFHHWPQSDPRAEANVILFLEPLDERNRVALGFDMASEATRRAAMERARDEGRPAASGPVRLVQESNTDPQPGFLIYVPVYQSGEPPESVDARRESLVGFVYAPLRAGDLLRSVLGDSAPANFDIYGGPDPASATRLYRSGDAAPPPAGPEVAGRVDIAGHPWTMVFTPRAGSRPPGARLVAVVALIGTLLSLVLYATTRALALAEGRLRRSGEALSESEEQFRTAFALAAVGQTQFDARSGRFLRVNAKFCGMLGYAEEELLDKTFQEVTHPDDRESSGRELQRLLAGRASESSLEKRYIRKDGTPVWARVNAALVHDGAGRPVRSVAVIEDITERRQAEQGMAQYAGELASQASELARSNADLADFAHVAAHDLKEPLRGIRHTAAFLIEDYGDRIGDEGRERLTRLDNLAQRMHSLLDSLLEFGQVGRSDLALRECSLESVVSDVAATLAGLLQREEVELVIHAPLPAARCDRTFLGQALMNLIANGIKYNESAKKRIEIGAAERDGFTVFYVRDNGIGIDPTHHAAVFRMFKRLHTRERYGGGSGAGLAIAKRIIERHGGRIWVESLVGQGSTFYFTLAPGAIGSIGAPESAGRGARDREQPLVEIAVQPGMIRGPVGTAGARNA